MTLILTLEKQSLVAAAVAVIDDIDASSDDGEDGQI